MQPFRSILVPVDFSDLSANAFRYALRLADQLDAGVDLLHVVPPSDGSLMSMDLTQQYVDLGKEKLLDFFTKGITALSGKLAHVPAVRSYVKKGDLGPSIQQHVKEQNNNLIVMGTHGGADGKDEFFGTNTSKLVSRLPRPVLVVPKGFAFQPLQSICYATDLTHLDPFRAGHLLKVLRAFKPRLDFVHVKTGKKQETKFNMDLLRKVFDQSELELNTRFHTLEDDDVVEGIFEFAQEISANLVVMHRPHHSWLSRIFGKSSTREAVLEASIPLLVLPQDQEEKQSV